jgi:hypothetical protein
MDIDIQDLEPGWETKLKNEWHFPDSIILEVKKLIMDEYDDELLQLRNYKFPKIEPEQFKHRHEYEHATLKEAAQYLKFHNEVQWRTKHYASLLNIPKSQWARDLEMARRNSKSVRGDFDSGGNREYRKKKIIKPKQKRKVCRCKK